MRAPVYQSFPMQGAARAQVWSYSPQFRRPRHFHAEPELNLIVAGSARFSVGSAVLEVHAGELLEFAPGQDHALLSGSPDLQLFAIGLRPDFSAEVLSKRGARPFAASLRSQLSRSELTALTLRAATTTELGSAEQLVAELWQAAERARHTSERTSLGTRRSPAQHVLTRRALGLLNENPELARSELARVARANPSEISRYFQRDLGITLVRYRTRLRVLRFIELADRQASAASLTAAALEAGFGSYSQCHRSFHAELGCSPQQFLLGELRSRMENTFEPEPAAPTAS